MKRILLIILSSTLLFFNNFSFLSKNINVPASLNLSPENQIYKLHESKGLEDLISVQSTHQDNRMAVAYIDTVGITRSTINLYDFNFELINQYQIDQNTIPKLNTGNNGVTNFSNSIVTNNQIITYFQTDTTVDSSSRHKLLVYNIADIDNPIPYLVELVSTGNSKIANNIKLEIEYVNNRIYLTIVDLSNSSFTISELTYNLSSQLNGYYQGTITYLVGSTSQIISVDQNSSLDYCQTFSVELYCLDHNQPNKVYNLSLNSMPISQTVFSYHNFYIGIETANNITKVKIFKTQKNSANSDLELVLIKEFVIESSYVRLAQLNFLYNRAEVYDINYKYMINLNTGELTSAFFDNFPTKEILYNQSGKKLEVDYSDSSLIYASSYFDNLTYVIQNYGFTLLAFNYHNDDLLFVAYDNVNQKYFYYAYTISLLTSGGAPRKILEFTKEDVRLLLNAALGQTVYGNTSAINLISFRFYGDELFVVDKGRVVTSQNLNIINFKANDTRFVYLYNSIALEIPFDQSYRFSVSGSGHLNLLVNGIVNGVVGFESFEIDRSKANQLNASSALGFGVGNDFVGLYTIGEFNYLYQLDYSNYTIRILKREGGTVIDTLDIKIPKTALKPLINYNYGDLYSDFSNQFPYVFFNFAFDKNNNLYITDYLNNIHILYNQDLRSTNNPGVISINNDNSLDVNSTSFDLAVSNSVSSLNILMRAFFERVLVTNSSPFNLNEGLNVITTTLKALDNTIRTITFNVFRAPSISTLPPITLPGLDPNYVSSSSISSSVVSSSIASSSVSSSSSSLIISSSSVSSSVISSSISSSIISNSSVSSPITSNDVNNSNNQEKPYFIIFLVGLPAGLTFSLYTYISYLKKKPKVKINQPSSSKGVSPEDSKDNKI